MSLAQSQDCGSGERAADGMQERGSLFPEEVVLVTRLEMISLQKPMAIFGEARNTPFGKEKGKRAQAMGQHFASCFRLTLKVIETMGKKNLIPNLKMYIGVSVHVAAQI